jgi:hypothetical protein
MPGKSAELDDMQNKPLTSPARPRNFPINQIRTLKRHSDTVYDFTSYRRLIL